MSKQLHKDERWAWIPGYEGLYKVSTSGSLLSFHHDHKGTPLATSPGRGGYLRAALRRDRKTRLIGIHRLVLLAFAGPCPNCQETRHLNGKRDDNRLRNLRWGTHEMNCVDRDRHGTTAKGSSNSNSVLSNTHVRKIRRLYASGAYTFASLAKLFGVDTTTIYNAAIGKTWRHVKENKPYEPKLRSTSRKLSPALAVKIREDFLSGHYTMRALAAHYGVSSPTIVGIVRGNIYPHAGGPDCSRVRTEKNTPRKLTIGKVKKIRSMYASGKYTQQQLGERFSVSGALVSQIVRNKIWT